MSFALPTGRKLRLETYILVHRVDTIRLNENVCVVNQSR